MSKRKKVEARLEAWAVKVGPLGEYRVHRFKGDALRDDSQDADDPTGVVHLVEADPLSRAKERVLKAAKKWQAWQQPDVPAPRGTLFTDLEEEMKRAVEALRKAEGKK